MKHKKLASIAMGIAVATALTGCGDDGDSSGFADESAATIVEAAQQAMASLESVHIDADISSSDSNIKLDLSLSKAGSCEGTVEIAGGSLEVLQVDGTGWYKADEAFWQEQAPEQADEIVAVIGDKWVSDPEGQFTSFCDLDSFLEEIVKPDDDDKFEKSGTDEVDGEDTVKVEGEKSTAFIATDDPHYILKIQSNSEGEGDASFSEFDEDVDVEAPAAEDVTELQ